MTMTTLTLTDFLLARIAEDEVRARDLAADAMTGSPWKHFPKDAYDEIQSMALTLSHRTRVDSQVKRRIVAQAVDLDRHDGYSEATRDAVMTLAAVYADHPDYRNEWKP